jgi:hypothetical protein
LPCANPRASGAAPGQSRHGKRGLYPSPSRDRCCLSKGSLPGRYSARNAGDLASVSDGTSRRPLSRRPDDSGRHVRERRPPNAPVEIPASASCLSTHAAGAGIDQGAELGGPRAGHRRPWPRGSLVSVELDRQIGQTNRTDKSDNCDAGVNQRQCIARDLGEATVMVS